jgi:hypothetical protein
LNSMLRQACVDQRFKCRPAPDWIGHWQAQQLRLARKQARRLGRIVARCIQTDACTTNGPIGARAKAQREVDDFGRRRQRVLWMAQHLMARWVVTNDDNIGLAAVQQAE